MMEKPGNKGAGREKSLSIFFKDLKKHSLLTKEEEIALAKRRDAGDRTAVNEFVTKNLRLVTKMAGKFNGRGLELLELVNEGSIGLMKAAEKFKIEKDCRFSTYASWWIHQAMQRAITDQAKTVRVPVHMQGILYKIERAKRELEQEERELTAENIAEKVGRKPEEIKRALKIRKYSVSLDAPVGGNPENGVYIDFMEDEDIEDIGEKMDNIELTALVLDEIQKLPSREQEIIKLRYGIEDGTERSLKEVGDIHGLTRERIRQITDKTREKIRTNLMQKLEKP